MWKQYMQPTKSARARCREANDSADKTQAFPQRVNILKEDLKNDRILNAQSFDRIEKEQFATIYTQMFALKKAFADLADAMMEEVEGVRSDCRAELEGFKEAVKERLEMTEMAQKTYGENNNKVNFSLTNSIKQAFQHMQALKSGQEKNSMDLELLKNELANRESGKFDNLERIEKKADENRKIIEKVMVECQELSQKLKETEQMPKQFNYVLEKEKEKSKAFEDHLFREIEDLDKKMKAFLTNCENLGNKKEIIEMKNEVVDLQNKIDDSVREMKSELIKVTIENEKRWEEFSREQEGLSDFVCGEIKAVQEYAGLGKRIEFLEELSTTQRREIFNSLTSLEQSFYRKQEKIIKAIYQLARNQDMPEAILSL
jgi:hypothetical protein